MTTAWVTFFPRYDFGDFLHLSKNHGGNLLGCEGLGGSIDINLDRWLAILLDDVEWEVLHITLDILVVNLRPIIRLENVSTEKDLQLNSHLLT